VEEYRLWLVGELEAVGEPVDLVGHDWGGGHVANVAMTRPDLLRSWCSDILGVFEPDYVWHDMAQVWQTPGAGEEAAAAMVADPATRAAGLVARGVTPDVAEEMAKSWSDDMVRCVLALYRDAAQPAMARLGEHLPTAAARPGLAIQAVDDHFVGTDDMRRRAAERAGARVDVLDGLGHWWMLQDPARAAAVLTEFWESLR
jgi:pimeloyl-ACP methyl ester carboxylesterase